MDKAKILDKWFSEHHNELAGFLLKLTSDYDESRDIIQETYVRAFLKFHLFRPDRGSLKNWLYRIAVNLYRDTQRFSCKQKKAELEHAYLSSSKSGSEDEEHELKELAWKCIERLDPDRKALLLLSATHKYSEISEILGIPEGTVKSRVHTIRIHVRKAIAKIGGFNG